MPITAIAIEKVHHALSNRSTLRLIVLALACLALLACLGVALFTERLASAQSADDSTAAWSATLTVGSKTSHVPTIIGYSTWGDDMGALSDQSFTLDQRSYRVLTALTIDQGLYLNISRELPKDFTLAIGDQEFVASDSLKPASVAAGRYWWEADDLEWKPGDAVAVSISLVDGSGALPERPAARPFAYASDLPEDHDGADPFTFALHFTDDILMSYKRLRDQVLDVTNATVTKAKRRTKGSNRLWEITVQPDAPDHILVSVLADRQCSHRAAVCTKDGRKLYNDLKFTVTGSNAPTPTPPPPTPTPSVTPAPTPTQIPGRPELYERGQAPEHIAHISWMWPQDADTGQPPRFRELTTAFTIQNDVGNFSSRTGLYLMLGYHTISDAPLYYGIQTRNDGSKALIFSRWDTVDLSNARLAPGGFAEAGDYEGDFISVRRHYEWGAGEYRVRLASHGADNDGEWFGVWITDVDADTTTWFGSLKFPLAGSEEQAWIKGTSHSTIEIYGQSIKPIDIPVWEVALQRPVGDGASSSHGVTGYGHGETDFPNGEIHYDTDSNLVNITVGGATEQLTPPQTVNFP